MARVSRQELRQFALDNPERYLEVFGEDDPLGMAPDLRAALEVPPAPEEEPTAFGEFAKGVGAGVDNLQASAYGVGAMAAQSFGRFDDRDAMLEGYQRNVQEAQDAGIAVPSYEDIGGVRDAGLYVSAGLGQLVPSVATSVVGGGAGGILARGAAVKAGQVAAQQVAARGGEEVLQRQIEKQIAGQIAGRAATVGAASTEGGTIAGQVYGDNAQEGDYGILKPLATGVAAGALGGIADARVVKALLGTSKAGITRTAGTVAGLESATEVGQTALENLAKDDPLTQGMVDAGILGAIGGGVLGGAARAVGGAEAGGLGEGDALSVALQRATTQANARADARGLTAVAPDPLYQRPDGSPIAAAPPIETPRIDGAIPMPDRSNVIDLSGQLQNPVEVAKTLNQSAAGTTEALRRASLVEDKIPPGPISSPPAQPRVAPAGAIEGQPGVAQPDLTAGVTPEARATAARTAAAEENAAGVYAKRERDDLARRQAARPQTLMLRDGSLLIDGDVSSFAQRFGGRYDETLQATVIPARQAKKANRALDDGWGLEPRKAPAQKAPAQAAPESTGTAPPVSGEAPGWKRFKMGESLGIPRAQMPQIKAGDRSSLVQFLRARGVENTQETVDSASLKPSQIEYSPEKVAAAREFVGEDRAILVSSDNRIVDGHHQWMARREAGVPIRVIRLQQTAKELLPLVREFPSATFEDGSTRNMAPAPTPRADEQTVDRVSENEPENALAVSESAVPAALSRKESADGVQTAAQSAEAPGAVSDPVAPATQRETKVSRRDRIASVLTEAAEDRGDEPPRRVRVTETPVPLRGAQLIIGQTFGRQVVFYETDDQNAPNGFADPEDPKTLYINTASEKPLMRVLMHELLHSLRTTNEKSYRALLRAVRESLESEATSKWRETYLRKRARKDGGGYEGDISDALVIEEIMADAMGDYGATQDFWQKLSERMEPNLFQRVVQTFAKILQKAMDALGKKSDMGSKRYFSDLQAVQRALLEFADQNRLDRTDANVDAKAERATAQSRKTRGGVEEEFSDPVVDAYMRLADDDAMFQYKTSSKKDFEELGAELLEPKYEVFSEEVDPAYRKSEKMKDGRVFPRVVKQYGISREYKSRGADQFSKATVYVAENGTVWLDVSTNERGTGGSEIYNAVANYAFNNDMVFVEDPAGLSGDALARRVEHMLSQAMKFGTIRHMRPGDKLLAPIEVGPANNRQKIQLDWSANDERNIRQLIDFTSQRVIAEVPEIEGFDYNLKDGKFVDQDGNELGETELDWLARTDRDAEGSNVRRARAGRRTLERALLGRSLVRQLDGRSVEELRGVSGDGRPARPERSVLYARRVAPPPVGKNVPATLDAEADLDTAFRFAASQVFGTNRAFKVELQKRIRAVARGMNRDLSEETDGNDQFVTRMVVRDAKIALRDNANAVGWYNEKVTKARAVLALIHPEIATDEDARFAFTWALAATSNGLKVDKNFELAERAYRKYSETGSMPTDIGIGTAGDAINEAMHTFNDMAAKMPLSEFRELMTTKAPASEIAKLTGYKVSGESPDAEVYGAAIIGPKIGNGFFANLYGHFEQLTMDRWLMRTWGRWTGTLIERNQEQVNAKRELLPSLVSKLSADDRAELGEILGRRVSDKASGADDMAAAITKASQKKSARDAMAALGSLDGDDLSDVLGALKKGQARVSVGDEIRKAGNALTKYLDGQKEAPSGAVERRRIRRVFSRGLSVLQKDHPDLTMSDLQALLWYPEKRLYDAAGAADEAEGGYTDDEAPDYANAAVKLAGRSGIEKSKIDAVLKEVDRDLARRERGSGRAQPGDGKPGAPARARREEGVRFDRREVGDGGRRPGDGSDADREVQAPERGVPSTEGAGAAEPSGQARREELTPLPGAPKVPGVHGPIGHVVDVAEQYARDNNIPLRRQSEFVEVDPERAARIADAYTEMEHAPNDPRVKAAYRNLIKQTTAQYEALVAAGYKFWFIDIDSTAGQRYASSPWNAIRDLSENKSLGVFPTDAGFGTGEDGVAAGNPMESETEIQWPFGGPDGPMHRVLANDLFRAVHDVFGHGMEGAGFRDRGEENAWQAHARLFTGDAVGAITSETRGQNSWLNYGPHGEHNRTASTEDTIFAEQKTGLMPEWTWLEGRAGDMPRKPMLSRAAAAPRVQPLFAGAPAMELGDETLREKATRLLVNNMNRVAKAKDYLASRGAVFNDTNDVETAETLYYGKTGEMLRQLDKAHVKPLLELVKRVENMGLGIKEVDEYLIAKHAKERNDAVAAINPKFPDGGSGMKTADARSLLASYSGPRKAGLEAVSQAVQAIHKERVRMLRDFGLTDQAELQMWQQKYQNYVPLKTVDDEPDALGTGMGYDIRGSESKRATGRGSRATSPLMVSILDAQRTIIRAQKAEVGRTLLRMAEQDTNEDLFEIRDQDAFRTTVFNKASGHTQEALDTAAMRDAFAVKEKGQLKFIVVKDEVLKAQLQKIGASQVGPVLNLIGKGTRTLSKLYTQYNPSFTLVNAVRDAITAAVNAQGYERISSARLIAQLPKAWKAIAAVNFGKGSADWKQMYEEFLADGASSAGFGLDTIRDLRTKAEREFKLAVGQNGLGRGKQAWHAAVRGMDAVGTIVSNANEVFENAARLSLYAQARGQGYTRQQAARMAKEITVNFNRKGEWGGQINSAFMFFNAAVQGNRALYLHMQKSPKVKAAVFGIGAIGFALAMLNDGMGDDEETGDEVENKVSDFELDHSAVLFTDSTGERIKFPLPYGYNVAFVLGRRAYRLMMGKDGAQKTAIGVVGSFYDAFMPLGGSAEDSTLAQAGVRMLLPTIGTPFFDLAVNRDQFGKPIAKEVMSRYEANTPESQRYFKGVTGASKAITSWLNEATGGNTAKAGAIDVNPEHLDFWFKFMTGGVGATVAGVAQLAGDEPTVDRAPIVKAFYGDEPDYYVSKRFAEVRKVADVLEGRMRDRDGTLSDEELRIARSSRMVNLSLNRLYKRLRAAEAMGNDTEELNKRIEQQQRRLIKAYNGTELGRAA